MTGKMDKIKLKKTALRRAFSKSYTKLEELIIDDDVDFVEIEVCLQLFKQKAESLELAHTSYLNALINDEEYMTEFDVVEDYREKALRIELKSKRILKDGGSTVLKQRVVDRCREKQQEAVQLKTAGERDGEECQWTSATPSPVETASPTVTAGCREDGVTIALRQTVVDGCKEKQYEAVKLQTTRENEGEEWPLICVTSSSVETTSPAVKKGCREDGGTTASKQPVVDRYEKKPPDLWYDEEDRKEMWVDDVRENEKIKTVKTLVRRKRDDGERRSLSDEEKNSVGKGQEEYSVREKSLERLEDDFRMKQNEKKSVNQDRNEEKKQEKFRDEDVLVSRAGRRIKPKRKMKQIKVIICKGGEKEKEEHPSKKMQKHKQKKIRLDRITSDKKKSREVKLIVPRIENHEFEVKRSEAVKIERKYIKWREEELDHYMIWTYFTKN